MGIANDLLTDLANKLKEGSTVKEYLDQIVADERDTLITSDTDAVAVVPEVWEVDVSGGSSGTFDLDIDVNGETISLTSVAYNVAAATLESAIDTAADGNVTDFTAGDISVSGGTGDANPLVLTFDGDSVLGATIDMTLDDASVGGSPVGTAAQDTAYAAATAERPAVALLIALGVISGTAPAFGVAPTDEFTAAGPLARPGHYPPQEVIKALLAEIELTEGVSWVPYMENLLGIKLS